MTISSIQYSLLQLVRIGLGYKGFLKDVPDWNAVYREALKQGVLAIAFDGYTVLFEKGQAPEMPIQIKTEWIGSVLQYENSFWAQQKTAKELASLYSNNFIRTYVLKGYVVSECYPKPAHRLSSDFDCFLVPDKDSSFDAWELGNSLIENMGFPVDKQHYKNSAFTISGLYVENHKFLTPFRGNKRLTSLEKVFQKLIHQDGGDDVIEGTNLCRPPIMVTSLFLIEHAYSHFLHEGLTLRYLLDWMMFKDKHNKDILWSDFDAIIEEFGFRKFYDSYLKLGKFVLGEINENELNNLDKRMLADVWDDLDIHPTKNLFKSKLSLAGNTLRAYWKYHYFSPVSMICALWIQIKGYFFMKNPVLD